MHALAFAHAAEIEAHGRKTARSKCLVQRIGDFVVHGAAMFRVRVQYQRQRSVYGLGMGVASLDAAGRAVDDDFRHAVELSISKSPDRGGFFKEPQAGKGVYKETDDVLSNILSSCSIDIALKSLWFISLFNERNVIH